MSEDFLLPTGMTVAAAARELAAGLHVRAGKARCSHRAYYDTFDGLLHSAGLLAVWEDGQLALIERDSDQTRARLEMEKPNGRLFASDVEPGRLSEALHELIDVRALLPLVEIDLVERPLDVLDSERKTIVRMLLERPTLARRRLAPRVHVVAVRGYEEALRGVSQMLGSELGFPRAEQSLLDEAVIASGGKPGGTPAKIDLAIAKGERSDRAAAAVLRALLDVIEANLDGAVADVDSEFLHDLRVSVRRSRAVQRELRTVFPPERLAHFREELRWLQQITGDARDLDVYVLEFDAMRALVPESLRADLDPVLDALRRRRTRAHRRMSRALRSERTAALFREWSAFLDGIEELPLGDRPDAASPVAVLAGERIRKVYRRMVRMGGSIDSASPSTEYHELRKQGKELRYLLELFGAVLYPESVVKPMIKDLKALQDVLGRNQDREVQVAMLRSLSDEVSAAPGGSAALMAMGVLVERLEADKHAARLAFGERFEAFGSASRRRLVQETFV